MLSGQREASLGVVKLGPALGRDIPALIRVTLGTLLFQLFLAERSLVRTRVTDFAGLLLKVMKIVNSSCRMGGRLRELMTALALHAHVLAFNRVPGMNIMIKLPLGFPIMAVIGVTHGTLV